VAIIPLRRETFKRFYNRPRGQYDSTEFSITRFLVPFLCGFQDFAVYLDGDMVVLGDVGELGNYMTLMDQYGTAVRVVKHDYEAKGDTKFLNAVQTHYQKKNWSSVILFNNALCTKLTPDYVENAPGLELHQFGWLKPTQVSSLPTRWNHLIGEPGYEPGTANADEIKLIHYTQGTPCFEEYKDCEYATYWHAEYADMNSHG
jgi:lipopolysaccharide biosynthesis glycosyltransferase